MRRKISIPNTLTDAYERKKLVLFIGAGLSAPCGISMWKELMSRLIEECIAHGCCKRDAELLKKWRNKKQYTKVAEKCKKLLPGGSFITTVRRACTPTRGPSKVHKAILSLSLLPFIITTNFDKVLENTYSPPGTGTVPVFTHLPDEIGLAINQDGFFIFKLHGDIDRPSTIILTQKEYDGMKGNKVLDIWLKTVFFNNTLLFVGYSISDPDINYFLKSLKTELDTYAKPHYAIISYIRQQDKQKLMKKFNVTTLQIPKNQIERFLRLLSP